jgi:hypothetical protein
MTSHSEDYSRELGAIKRLLDESQDPAQVEAMLLAFNERWSSVPPVKIVPGELWNRRRPFVRHSARFTRKEDAINNLTAAGRTVSGDDEKYIEYLMTYPFFVWSPSDSQHMDEPGFHFLRWRYAHLGYLYPIFDDVIWPEVVENIPASGRAEDSFRMMFAGKDYYYVYDSEDQIMFRAGKTLEDVYEGLKAGKGRWCATDQWEVETPAPTVLFQWHSFPKWDKPRDGGRWILINGDCLDPFVEPTDED